MSVAALKVYETLRAGGVDEARARVAAEAIDQNTAEQIAESEGKAAEKFVAKDAYSARMEQTPTREETQSEYAKLREDNKALREEMRSGFQHIGRVNTAVFVMILALILKDIFLG